MTPEERAQLNELMEWKRQRELQQLSYPVDDASRNALRAVIGAGAATHAFTRTITIGAGGGSASVAVTPTGFITIDVEGAQYVIATYN